MTTGTQVIADRGSVATTAAAPRARWRDGVPLVVVAVVAALAPLFVVDDYYLGVACLALTYVVIGSAFNLLYGYLGMLSFAQVAFFGIGGYVTAWLSLHTELSMPLQFLAGGAAAALVAAVVGAVTVRLSEGAFAIITLSFTLLCAIVAAGWTSVTGGRQGLFALAAPEVHLGSRDLVADTPQNYYRLLAVFAVVALAVMWGIVSSRWGNVLVAIRDNEPLARSQGYRTNLHKLVILVLSAGITGLAGALHVFRLTTIDPSVFDFYLMQAMLIIVVLGGAGTFWPVVVSAVAFAALPEILRSADDWRLVVYGGLLVAGLLVLPQGVGGYLRDRQVRRRLTGPKAGRA